MRTRTETGEVRMKHLFLSGTRMEDVSSIHALFQSGGSRDALYQELWRKYESGSMDRWLSARRIEKTEGLLAQLCGYTPSEGWIPSKSGWTEPGNKSARIKVDRLRTTGWFASQKDLFTDGHDWEMTATCNEELEDVFDIIREGIEEGGEEPASVYLCNVREVYEINPRQLSDIHFIGFGQPTVRLDCTYRETVDLSLLRLSFEGVKLDSSAPCFLTGSDAGVQNCRMSETVQADKTRR